MSFCQEDGLSVKAYNLIVVTNCENNLIVKIII